MKKRHCSLSLSFSAAHPVAELRKHAQAAVEKASAVRLRCVIKAGFRWSDAFDIVVKRSGPEFIGKFLRLFPEGDDAPYSSGDVNQAIVSAVQAFRIDVLQIMIDHRKWSFRTIYNTMVMGSESMQIKLLTYARGKPGMQSAMNDVLCHISFRSFGIGPAARDRMVYILVSNGAEVDRQHVQEGIDLVCFPVVEAVQRSLVSEIRRLKRVVREKDKQIKDEFPLWCELAASEAAEKARAGKRSRNV